jgi:exonuclease III
MINKLNLVICAINVNSLNVSTLGSHNAKTFLKIEGITGKRADVILLCDVRAKNRGEEIKKLFNLTMNGSYKIYLNSTRETRGVGIAIKHNIAHEIKGITADLVDENYLLLDLVIKGNRLNLGVVYGLNENKTGFYKKVRKILNESDFKFIIGGDFNTILSNEEGTNNVDRIGNGRLPNSQNSRLINEWITEGFALDPFRALYPMQQEASHIPFRSDMDRAGIRNYVHNRLDFFLISPDLLGLISKVKYKDRLSADFDHKEVVMTVGRAGKNINKIVIYDSTLTDLLSDNAGMLAVYDALCTHLRTRFRAK